MQGNRRSLIGTLQACTEEAFPFDHREDFCSLPKAPKDEVTKQEFKSRPVTPECELLGLRKACQNVKAFKSVPLTSCPRAPPPGE